MIRRATSILGLVAVAAAVFASAASAQFTINARAGLGVPTGTIADSDNAVLGVGAESGLALGAGFGIGLGDRWTLRVNGDLTSHSTEASSGTAGPDVDVLHFIAGLGYLLTDPNSPFYVSVNAGAGLMSFDIDAPSVDAETYFAINAGAEIGYWVSDNLAIFASPQGDIAFSDEDVLGSSTAFVWPFTGGIKVKLGS